LSSVLYLAPIYVNLAFNRPIWELLRLPDVAAFQPRSRQLVLTEHNRAHTLKPPVPRIIPLNDAAYAIVSRPCEGRNPVGPILTYRGKRWRRRVLPEWFARVRERAGIR
jgi:hypothetical protein